MSAVDRLSNPLLPPLSFEVNGQVLGLDSVLDDLPMYEFQVEATHTGSAVAQMFERYPRLPGVVLIDQGKFLGMISRQRLLEYLLKPHGTELFLANPLAVLHSYTQNHGLMLPRTTPILLAAQQALRRSPDQQAEPIIVQYAPQEYRLLDVHELNIAYWQIRGIETQVRYERSQAQMIQSERMASLGRLVDGIAHEILDPVGFIWGNLSHVSLYAEQLLELLHTYQAILPEPPAAIRDIQETVELDYLEEDLPNALDSIRSGAERLKKLVTSLQNFCHVDEVYPKPADVNDCLDGILLLLKSRLTTEIQVVRNYGQLPPVSCYIGQLSQVFMNILTNAVNALINQAVYQEWAAHCMSDRPDHLPICSIKPQIFITTEVRSHPDLTVQRMEADSGMEPASKPDGVYQRWVSIRIANNGPAMSPETYRKILDSFSVEQRAAKETSLALSYQIVTAKHGGRFYLRSPCFLLDQQDSMPQPNVQTNSPVNEFLSHSPCPNPASTTCLIGSGTEFEIVLPL